MEEKNTNYYDNIKMLLTDNEITQKVKDYSKNKSEIYTYYMVGKELYEAGKHYGEDIIGTYSKKLISDVDKKYNKRMVFRIRKFYITFNNEKVATLSPQLTWSHYIELLSLNDINRINYYTKITNDQSLSVRDLREKIKNKEYERLDKKTKEKLIRQEKEEITDYIKNPIIIKSKKELPEEISEKFLKQMILENMEDFLLELGSGFSFIKSEYKIIIGNNPNYIDLLLFNIEYNCYVVVELKITKLKKEHIGQIQVYMNYIDKTIKKPFQDKTIGIIICKKDNKLVLSYSSDSRIYSTVYQII